MRKINTEQQTSTSTARVSLYVQSLTSACDYLRFEWENCEC